MCDRESILISVKNMLGIEADETAFDTELILHINSVFMVLYQLGVGPTWPFTISGPKEAWSDFLNDQSYITLTKSYMYLKVRLLFDPPQSGVLHEAMERQVEECEWRLNVMAETPIVDANSKQPEKGGEGNE